MGHVIITGPGKCGGSLAMQLFTELGMDTGFPKGLTFENNDAGGNYEWPVRGGRMKEPFPHIIKEPQMCADIDLRIKKLKLDVEHIYILFRRPGPEAAALEFIKRESKNKDSFEEWLSGKDLDRVTRALALRELQVVNLVAELDIPHTLVSYPRFAADAPYAHSKFKYLMDTYKIDVERCTKVWNKIVDQDLVQDAYATQPEWNRAKMREAWKFRSGL